MAKKNKIDRKYFLLESETVKMDNNQSDTTVLAPDDFAVLTIL